MKKIKQKINKSYPPLVLYWEDINEIIQVFEELGLTPEFKTKEYSFETVAELEENCKNQRLTDFCIQSHDPYISVDFSRDNAWLYSNSNEPLSAGVFWKIDQILLRCKRFGSMLISGALFLIIAVPLSLGLGFFFFFDVRLGIVASLFFGLWVGCSFWFDQRRHSTVWIRSRSEAGGFFKRNKDQLIVAILAAVIGGAIGVVGTLLAGHYFTK